MIEYQGYQLGEPEGLETPAMLVFQAQVEHNLRAVCELAGGAEKLMVHVKTHKSADITRQQLAAGVAGCKGATLKEVEMVLAAGARQVVLAYPLMQPCKVERFAGLVAAHPEARVCAMASAPAHVELLAQVAQARQQRLQVVLDLDIGMHRTGVALGEEARALYQQISGHPWLEAAGLHGYDGHEHITDPAAREAAARRHVEDLQVFKAGLERDGMAVPSVIGGSSFTFPYYARTEGIYGSPGTCIYWDTRYGNALPDMPFRWAALVLAQVVDRHPGQRTITTDLGVKAISADPPLERRALLLGQPATLIGQTEEHGVFRLPEELPEVGTYLLAVPGHICTTTIRYPGSYVIDAAGEVVDYYPHTARDRR